MHPTAQLQTSTTQCAGLEPTHEMASRGTKRSRNGKDKGPAAKQRRLEDRFMKVMDLVATGQAVRPASNMVFGRPRGSSLSQQELKGCDILLTIAGPIVATTGTNGDMFTLNLIQPGTASYNRIGRKIYMQSVRLRGIAEFALGPAATTFNKRVCPLRMVVVYDAQPQGVVPTFETIFMTTLQDGTEGGRVLAPLRFDNTGRFRVLRDKIIEAGSPTDGYNTGGTTNLLTSDVEFDEFVPLRGLETIYSGQSSPCTIADISSGALYVFFRSIVSSDDVTDWSIRDTSFARLRYKD